jgi:NADH dehydrogenase
MSGFERIDMSTIETPDRHKVVVIGSGFGGLFGTKALRRSPVDVTVLAKTTHHLFQPLLYQVATGILSEGEIAPPTREVLASQDNAQVLLGEVTGIDLEARLVTSHVLGRETVTPYDSLIVAAGAKQSYFGNDQFSEHAPGMKSIDDALELRGTYLRRVRDGRARGQQGRQRRPPADVRGRRSGAHRCGDGGTDRGARAPHAQP